MNKSNGMLTSLALSLSSKGVRAGVIKVVREGVVFHERRKENMYKSAAVTSDRRN
jgi:hypothetical protein